MARLATGAEETTLIARANAGDHDAFRALIEHYRGLVYTRAYRMLGDREEAEDAAQETFVRVYRQLARYDAGRRFSTWVLAIATHHCIDQLRRRQPPPVPLEGIALWARAREAGPEREALDRETRDELQLLLRRLPERHRAVLVLRYWQGLSGAEIAAVLRVQEGTARTRLYQARKALGALLKAQGTPLAHA
jgi:RNA polymerase sigma-70 factor (ECF subfamily)